MFDARAVLGIVLYFKEKVLKPLRKDGYLNRCNLPMKNRHPFGCLFFVYGNFIRKMPHSNIRNINEQRGFSVCAQPLPTKQKITISAEIWI